MAESTISAASTRFLFLMRHGEAGHPAGTRDRDRPLTERGEVAVAQMADRLRVGGWPITGGISSDARRARDTLTATGLLENESATLSSPALWDATPDEILAVVRHTAADTLGLLVVGHAPSIPALVRELARSGSNKLAEGQLSQRFPTAAVAVLSFFGAWSDLEFGRAELVEFPIPSDDQNNADLNADN